MRSNSWFLVLAWLVASGGSSVAADSPPGAPGYWLAGEVGVGSVHLASSLGSRNRDALAVGVEGGWNLTPQVGVGLRLNGWTIQASNLQDPSKGESLSQAFVILRIHPLRGGRFFLRGGAGYASYTNHHPLAFSGRGWGYSVGLGFRHPLTPTIGVAPSLNYNRGQLGDVNNGAATIHDRRYEALEISLGIQFP